MSMNDNRGLHKSIIDKKGLAEISGVYIKFSDFYS